MGLLWCTVDGDDLFSCDLTFQSLFFSLVLHQIVKFNGQFNECCPTDGIKRKMTRDFKEINTPSDLNHYLFDELFSVASNSSSFV